MMLFHDFRKRFKINRPLILDGAIGTELLLNKEIYNQYLWASEINFTSPQTVKSIHRKYLQSGAEIISTNTFRTNFLSYKNSNVDIPYSSFVNDSVTLAKYFKDEFNFLLAGCNAPAEDCYQQERTISKELLRENHLRHIEALYNSGVDFILNETQSHIDEIEIISEYCSTNRIPFVISIYFTEELKILSGESLFEVINIVKSFHPLAVSFNCITPSVFRKFMLTNILPKNWGFYLNCGGENMKSETLCCEVKPINYAKIFQSIPLNNCEFIGSCCGSNHLHTKAIKEYFDENIH